MQMRGDLLDAGGISYLASELWGGRIILASRRNVQLKILCRRST
jgi:hypothetical protein